MMRRVSQGCAAWIAVLAVPVAALAADVTPETKLPDGWTVTVGVEPRAVPRFEGSDKYEFLPYPLFDLRRAGTPPRFQSPRDGIGFALYEAGNFSAGPATHLEFARRVKSDPALQGLGDVKLAVETGAFFEYWPAPWLRGRIEIRRGFRGHHGVVSDQAVDVVAPVSEQWTLSGGPRMKVADHTANRKYFGINAEQSAASGLPIYDAKAGVKAVGAGAKARYQWNQQWATHAFLEYDRLTGDAGNSPLVVQRGSPNQTMVGAGVTYSFDIGGW